MIYGNQRKATRRKRRSYGLLTYLSGRVKNISKHNTPIQRAVKYRAYNNRPVTLVIAIFLHLSFLLLIDGANADNKISNTFTKNLVLKFVNALL